MAKSESGTRGRVVKIIKSYGINAYAVENMVGPGMPDVNYEEGWIEVKKTTDWPKRPDTPVRLDHGLMPTQKLWIRKHIAKGGRALVFVQVAREFLVFDGSWAVSCLGEVPRAEMVANAILHVHSWAEVEQRLKEVL